MKKKHNFFPNVRERVLFVTQTGRVETPYLDPSVRYRCYNHAEVLEDEGLGTDVIAQQKLTVRLTENYDAFVFHRPYGGDPNLVTCLDAIRKRGCRVIADYDDLIFAPEYALQSSIFLNGIRNETQTKGIFSNNYLGFMQFDSFTVSTGTLRDQILKLKPDAEVTVVRNGLSRRFVDSFDLPSRAERSKSVAGDSLKVISYLSGTASHNCDFASIADVLREFLNSHPEFRLVIAGPLELPDAFPRRSLIRMPHREYRDFFASVGTACFNIAPLKSNNVFNDCKSGLKFFESGIWGVPSVVSPLEDFKRFEDSSGIKISSDAEKWLEAMNLFADDEFRLAASRELPLYCYEKCMAKEPGLLLKSVLEG